MLLTRGTVERVSPAKVTSTLTSFFGDLYPLTLLSQGAMPTVLTPRNTAIFTQDCMFSPGKVAPIAIAGGDRNPT